MSDKDTDDTVKVNPDSWVNNIIVATSDGEKHEFTKDENNEYEETKK